MREEDVRVFLEVSMRLLTGAYAPEVCDTFTMFPPEMIGADLWCLLTRYGTAGLLVVLRYVMVEQDVDHREMVYDAIEMYPPEVPLTPSFLAALRVFEALDEDPGAPMCALVHQEVLTPVQGEAVIALVRALGRGSVRSRGSS